MQKTEKKKKSKNNIKTDSTAQKKPDSFKNTNESTSPARKIERPSNQIKIAPSQS
jgi:hypothetical protein